MTEFPKRIPYANWIESTAEQKQKWQNRTDAALDERIALMKIRDKGITL